MRGFFLPETEQKLADDQTQETQAEEQAGARSAGQSGGEQADGQETDWKAEAEKWKSLSRKHEARAKENFEKASEYDKYLESQKSEQEKQAEAYAKLQAERDEAMTSAALAQAALKYGLSAEDMELISGGSADDIESRAERLANRLASQKQKPEPDKGLGREQASQSSGDWLRDQFRK